MFANVLIKGFCCFSALASLAFGQTERRDVNGDGMFDDIEAVVFGVGQGRGSSIQALDTQAVSWPGSSYKIDSGTGAGVLLGASGFASLNCLAVDGSGNYYTFSGATLVKIDGNTGVGTNVCSTSASDFRAASFSPTGELYAVQNGGGTTVNDILVKIDVNTCALAPVGNMGVPGVQGLAFNAAGDLYGFETGSGSGTGFGLMKVNPATGVATDVNPGEPGMAATMQCLSFNSSGQLFGGRDQLYSVNITTGAVTLIGSGGYSDVRGIALELGGGCTGNENIKKAKCKKGKLKVKTVGAASGSLVTGTTTGSCGVQTKSVNAKANGSATLKFTGCASGGGGVVVDWECGATDSEIYNCP